MPKIKDGRIVDDPAQPEHKTGPTYHLRQPLKNRPSFARRWSREFRGLIGPVGGPGGGKGCGTKALVVALVAAALILAVVLTAVIFGGSRPTGPSSPPPVITG
jgi:hypothetical protein